MSDTSINKKPRARQILLVDDETDFTDFFKEFLLTHRPGAWIVHTANHYATALSCLKENSIDLVVLDLKMPVMDGLQFLPLLKKTHPEIQVIILTSSVDAENRTFCLQNGAALFFNKAEVTNQLEKIYDALETVAATPAEGFRGMLRQVGLSEVLQMECLGRKSSILEITGRGSSGRVYIQEGSILHAESGEQQGEPALFRLLALKNGDFKLQPFAKPSRQTIDGHWESLMMEAARLSDEASAGVSPDGAVKKSEAPPVVKTPRVIQEILLCSSTDELLYEWQATRQEKRIQLLDNILTLSAGISQTLQWTRGDRLEIEWGPNRAVILFQPDRKVFIRSAIPPQPNQK